MNDLDQTQWDTLAKKVCDLLEACRSQMDKAINELNFSGSPTAGIQLFKLERRNAIQIIEEWIGPIGIEFGNLPTTMANQHPTVFSINPRYGGYVVNEIQNHIDFLDALIRKVRFGPIEFQGSRVKEQQKVILRVFLDNNAHPDGEESLRILMDEFGFEIETLAMHLSKLKEKGLMRVDANHQELVSQAGIKELKRMENQDAETLEQKRFRVLKSLYDVAPNDKHGMVITFELAKVLSMGIHEVNRILGYWEEKGMLTYPADEAVKLTAPAIDEIEEKLNHPTRPTQHFPHSTQYIDNSIHIRGDVSGNVVGGQRNTYNERTNESLVAVLPKLAEFIAEVRRADFEHRGEVLRELEMVYELAHRPASMGLLEVLQSKIKSAEALMKLSGWGYTTYTQWPLIADTFHKLLQ